MSAAVAGVAEAAVRHLRPDRGHKTSFAAATFPEVSGCPDKVFLGYTPGETTDSLAGSIPTCHDRSRVAHLSTGGGSAAERPRARPGRRVGWSARARTWGSGTGLHLEGDHRAAAERRPSG